MILNTRRNVDSEQMGFEPTTLEKVIESDYTWTTNHISNIFNIFDSMEPLWQRVNIKNVLVNTFNVIIFQQKAYSHYVIPIVTNCHVEVKVILISPWVPFGLNLGFQHAHYNIEFFFLLLTLFSNLIF